MGKRRKARESALQALYGVDVGGGTVEDAMGDLRESFGAADPKVLEYAEQLVRGVADDLESLDELIQKHSPNWRVDRMARVDRNILRLAAYELRSRSEVPTKVAINEAIEIAKRFGTEDSGAFINGVLDKLAAELRGDGRESGAG